MLAALLADAIWLNIATALGVYQPSLHSPWLAAIDGH